MCSHKIFPVFFSYKGFTSAFFFLQYQFSVQLKVGAESEETIQGGANDDRLRE